jgi:very-short-patch-repair endonuclease
MQITYSHCLKAGVFSLRTKEMIERGYKVFRFWENKFDTAMVIDILRSINIYNK